MEERTAWDPFAQTTAKEELESWDPFEDLELLELTGDLALEAEDVEGLEAWLAQAASKLPWDKVRPKQERLEQLRKAQKEQEEKSRAEKTRLETEAQVSETEAIKSSAQQKLLRKRLVPSMDLELSEQEKAVLEKEQKENVAPRNQKEEKVLLFPVRVLFPDGSTATLEVNPCARGASVLTQLLPLKRSHLWPEDFAVFLPSGRLLDFHKPLQAQGVHGGMDLRVDEAGVAEPASKRDVSEDEETDFDNLHFSREVENGWNLIYWPLCVALATFDEAKQAMQKHKEVVVMGWNGCHDLEVMQLCQEVCFNVGSDYLIVTGSEAAPEEWWPTAQEEADLSAAERVGQLRGPSAPQRPKTSVLRIDPYAAPNELAPALLAGLRAAGCGTSITLLVVCRAYQSRRPVSVLNWCLQQEDYAQWRMTVLPYSWDPRFVYLEDCKARGNEVILEAQLLTEMNPMVWMEEEGQEAEIALSRLLLAHPTAVPRRHWHNGFYSKPFKERTRLARDGVAEHCEWFRWQKPAPLSAESHAAAEGFSRSTKAVAEPPEDDDEEPPPLVSHE